MAGLRQKFICCLTEALHRAPPRECVDDRFRAVNTGLDRSVLQSVLRGRGQFSADRVGLAAIGAHSDHDRPPRSRFVRCRSFEVGLLTSIWMYCGMTTKPPVSMRTVDLYGVELCCGACALPSSYCTSGRPGWSSFADPVERKLLHRTYVSEIVGCTFEGLV